MKVVLLCGILMWHWGFVPSGLLVAQERGGTPDAKLLAELAQLEKASWEAAMRQDKEFFRTFMAPEFRGFLADGTQVSRDDFLRNLGDYQLTSYTMSKISMLRINADAVMILYQVSYQGKHQGKAIKVSGIETSSLYVRRGGKWLEVFYQETQGSQGAKPNP